MALTLCVLLWPVPGHDDELVAYEDQVLALLPRHGASLRSRVRRNEDSDAPFEVHVIDLPDEVALRAYLDDPARLALAGLRDRAIARTEVIRVDNVSG